MNPLYLPERQHIRRKTAEWERIVAERGAYRATRAFRRRISWAKRRAWLWRALANVGPLLGFLAHLAVWSFIALAFTSMWMGWRR